MAREAYTATRPSRAASPFDHTIGLNIRLKPIHSSGYRLKGGIFTALVMTPLGGRDLPLIPWNELKRLSKGDFISDYLKPVFNNDDLKKLDESMRQIGTSFERGAKVGPKAEAGTFTSVSFKHHPYEALWDILRLDNNFSWTVTDDRVIVWVVLQFVDDDLPNEPSQKRKSRAKAKPAAPDEPSLRASPKASNIVKSEQPEVFEPISLEAFPQDEPQDESPSAGRGSTGKRATARSRRPSPGRRRRGSRSGWSGYC
jgi:hypothetical protein